MQCATWGTHSASAASALNRLRVGMRKLLLGSGLVLICSKHHADDATDGTDGAATVTRRYSAVLPPLDGMYAFLILSLTLSK